MIKLFTIGFTEKSAEEFFGLLQKAGVKRIIDVRLNNVSQLAGFAKGNDLKYFANVIGGIEYIHRVDLAPNKDILTNYRNKVISWTQYEIEYIKLLDKRQVLKNFDYSELNGCCLLCSEHKPDMCHRRLLAEYLKKAHNDIHIVHLIK